MQEVVLTDGRECSKRACRAERRSPGRTNDLSRTGHLLTLLSACSLRHRSPTFVCNTEREHWRAYFPRRESDTQKPSLSMQQTLDREILVARKTLGFCADIILADDQIEKCICTNGLKKPSFFAKFDFLPVFCPPRLVPNSGLPGSRGKRESKFSHMPEFMLDFTASSRSRGRERERWRLRAVAWDLFTEEGILPRIPHSRIKAAGHGPGLHTNVTRLECVHHPRFTRAPARASL